ncbi:hypothetical protein KUTeg_015540 [Tegillarca granosa]|uniref:DDE Tnp4 domain-containing protein n=1 Tax=Tegillarca granosa TaxID=220873 RepID=A0ABQ9ESV4_TEGGR|nr:hypothetical protein KUTeg_015540 [Tegillarca granosa]
MANGYRIARLRRRRAVLRRQKSFKCVLNPLNGLTDEDIFWRYRFRRETIMFSITLLSPAIQYHTSKSMAVPPLIQILATLRFLATGSFYRLVGNSLGLSIASVHRHLFRIRMTSDANYRITNCVAKCPGSIHDSRMFKHSHLCQKKIQRITSWRLSLSMFIRNPRVRIIGYVEDVIPRYSNEEFRRVFRLSRQTFINLCEYLKQCQELSVNGTGGREPIVVEKQLYVLLWYLGGTDTIHRIADRFGISESSVILSRDRTVDAILNNLKAKFISWPKQQELEETVANFQRRNGFPGIIILSYPGSTHDARVLRQSSLWDNGLRLCNGNHLVADAAYPLRRWLLTPYRDNGHLNQEQKHFNYMHSSNRVVIERAFGLLKGRYRLYHIDSKVETAVKLIVVACVLHNFCLLQHDNIEEFMEAIDDQNCAPLQFFAQENEAEGIIKRNAIARLLATQQD